MTTMSNEDPADPSAHEPRVTDAPDEIGASDVRYVRADAIAAERERKMLVG